MENKKYVSIIVPCFNSAKYMDRCMNSLLHQTIGIEHLEIILVNDASTDDTYERMLEYEKKSPDSILVINLEENMRQGGARNIALEYATGEYIAFLDADDWMDINAYKELYHLARESCADLLQFNHYNTNIYKSIKIENVKQDLEMNICDEDTRKWFLSKNVMTCGCTNKLYRTNLIKSVKSRYSEHCMYEEPPFVYPLLLFAQKICCTTKAYYYYYMNPESTVNKDMRKDENLMQHPGSQRFLLQQLSTFPKILEIYHDEIEWYFLHSFYFETLCFAGQRNLHIDIQRFNEMQQYAKEQFPNWRNNHYIQNLPFLQQVLDTLDIHCTQGMLDDLCAQIKNVLSKSR